MSTVEYRAYEEADAADVKAIINEAFYIDHYASGQQLIDSALEVYLRERLLASTWAHVAVADGRVVGFIMAQTVSQPRLTSRLKNRARLVAHAVRCAIVGVGQWRAIRQFFAFGPTYRRLRRNTGAPLDNELTLFAVARAARGFGVGNTLYRTYLDQLRTHSASNFYLYTDSLCTYGFYERHGMTRAAEEHLAVTLRGITQQLGVYLYIGNTHSTADH